MNEAVVKLSLGTKGESHGGWELVSDGQIEPSLEWTSNAGLRMSKASGFLIGLVHCVLTNDQSWMAGRCRFDPWPPHDRTNFL